jgi:restriction system protein
MITCANCSHRWVDIMNSESEGRHACPQCGSTTRVINLSAHLHGSSVTPDIKMVINSAPPFSFGAVVARQRGTTDGELIKLVDPIYTQLIEEIRRNPQVIYQIDGRKWEEIIAAAYDKAGFDEVILTPRSGDYGRDVIAIKYGFGSVKFIDQVKAYNPNHIVTAEEVRALLGVLQAEQNATKAIFTTTSTFAPKIKDDKFIKPFLPFRLELINKEKLLERLANTMQTIRNQC